MKHISEIWTNNGLFRSKSGVIEGVTSRITIPSNPDDYEAAAIIEIAGRIGLHLLSFPSWETLFIQDELDIQLHDQNRVCLVIGHSTNWLEKVLGAYAKEVIDQLKQISKDTDHGLIAHIRMGQSDYLILTGSTSEGVLYAARYLSSDNYGRGLDDGPYVVVSKNNGSKNGKLNLKSIGPQKEIMSLHNIFTPFGIYKKRISDEYPLLSACLKVDGLYESLPSMIEMAGVLTLYSASVVFPITALSSLEENSPDRLYLEFVIDPNVSEASVQLVEHGASREAEGLVFSARSQEEFSWLIHHVTNHWFEAPREVDGFDWRSKWSALCSSYPDICKRATIEMLLSNIEKEKKIDSVIVPSRMSPLLETVLSQSNIQFQISKEAPILRDVWTDLGELEELEARIFHTVSDMAGIHTDKPLSIWIEVVTTVSQETFDTWKKELNIKMSEQNLPSVRLEYMDANKSGLHWFIHHVLPEIKSLDNVYQVDIEARRFLAEDPHLDLPQRFLQELFPADQILVNQTELSLDRIHLGLMDQEESMFRITAWKDNENILQRWSWEGWSTSDYYMPDRPNLGKVRIPSSGFRVYIEGELQCVVSGTVAMNTTRFWHWYQSKVKMLPEIIENSSGYPKFLRLECHVTLDADDHWLNVHKECSSIAEALHEDIYFYTLHALSVYGNETGDPGWRSPGAIIPFIHFGKGSPHAELIVYGMNDHEDIQIVIDGSTESLNYLDTSQKFENSRVKKVAWRNGHAVVELSEIPDPKAKAMGEYWLNAESIAKSPDMTEQPFTKNLNHDILQNRDVAAWISNNVTNISGSSTVLDFSYEGEPIYALELFGPISDHTSRMKHSLYKPTIFINARHHANEVSSTNAALILINQLADNTDLLNHFNLVTIPLQNVDGSLLHEKLTKEHPFWKHHAARYSACGLEFAMHYFNPHTIFGESRTYSRIWESWKPDIILDDHGIPSHEWIQPFSGYNSPPQFPVSYWIPQARLYTIWNELHGVDSERKKTHELLKQEVTEFIKNDQLINLQNLEFLKRYSRWGSQFAPEAFPLELENGQLTYLWNIMPDPSSTGMMARFPHMVIADLITEVNDETVYGKELETCVYAHSLVHQALVKWISKSDSILNVNKVALSEYEALIEITRERPLKR